LLLCRLSPLFDPLTASNPMLWYNLTSDMGKAVPFGFMASDLPGMVDLLFGVQCKLEHRHTGNTCCGLAGQPHGYPLWLGNEMSASGVPSVLQYIKDGAYLSSPNSDQLILSMATLNRDLNIFFFWKGTFKWEKDGAISLSYMYQVCVVHVCVFSRWSQACMVGIPLLDQRLPSAVFR
jgi:hypothetical protein